jgi:hypothetical protein
VSTGFEVEVPKSAGGIIGGRLRFCTWPTVPNAFIISNGTCNSRQLSVWTEIDTIWDPGPFTSDGLEHVSTHHLRTSHQDVCFSSRSQEAKKHSKSI